MDNENLTPEEDVYDREDRCRRVIKNVTKAIVMRLVVVVLVIWAFTRAETNPWLIGLMLLLVVLITVSSLPILNKELSARRKELKALIASEEE